MIKNTKKYYHINNKRMIVDAIQYRLGKNMEDGFFQVGPNKRPYITASVFGQLEKVIVSEKSMIIYFYKKIKTGRIKQYTFVEHVDEFKKRYKVVKNETRKRKKNTEDNNNRKELGNIETEKNEEIS